MPPRPEVYTGKPQRLAIAFDIGPSESSISYSISSPGQSPKIHDVTRYPGDDRCNENIKVPTVMFYDKEGSARVIGAEAMRVPVMEIAEEEGWLELQGKWLLVRFVFPNHEGKDHPLPKGKTAVDALADYLVYMAQSASYFIQENHVFGMNLMRLLKYEVDYIFATPQYWDAAEERLIRQSFVAAGLVPDTAAGHGQIFFLPQAICLAHAVFQDANIAKALQTGTQIIVVDMNEEWTYIRCYSHVVLWQERMYNESAQPILTSNGSIFENLEEYLKDYLQDSPFATEIEHIIHCFQKTAMKDFSDPEKSHYIKFGSARDNDPEHHIKYGQLELPGAAVAQLYEYLIGWIFEYVSQQKVSVETTGGRVSHIVLTGSVSGSDWIYKQFQAQFSKVLTVCRAEHSSNSVSRGALIHYLEHTLPERLPKYHIPKDQDGKDQDGTDDAANAP